MTCRTDSRAPRRRSNPEICPLKVSGSDTLSLTLYNVSLCASNDATVFSFVALVSFFKSATD